MKDIIKEILFHPVCIIFFLFFIFPFIWTLALLPFALLAAYPPAGITALVILSVFLTKS
jgi:hypothetical protein